MLGLNRTLYCLDLETTGINALSDRIVQIGLVRIDHVTGDVKEWVSYVNPERPIPLEASESNHITDDMVKDAPTFKTLAEPLARRLHNCDFIGYNLKQFDLPLLEAEFKRVDVPWTYANANIIDAYRVVMKARPRNLTWFVKEMLGIDISETAHDAMVDASWTYKAFLGLLEKHPEIPRTPGELHAFTFTPAANSVDADGKVVWRPDKSAELTFGKHRGKPLEQVPPDYFRWIIDSNFSAELKAICRAALDGQFPRR